MAKVVLIVHFTVNPGSEQTARRLMKGMETETRKEPGCRAYVGLQSRDNPLAFSFYEEYDDQATMDAHWASPYFAEHVTNGLMPLCATREMMLHTMVSEG